MRWMLHAYKVWAICVVSLYALAGFTGYRVSSTERTRVEPTVRSSPGGYRSFHFWHSGSHGGK